MSKVLVTSCPCPIFPVNGLVFFCFLLCVRCWLCCCGCITKLEGSILLPYLIGNRQLCYSYISALIFGWIDVIPFLKGNGINKKPIIIYIVTISKWCIVNAPKSLKPIVFWNSLELSSWIFKRTFLSDSVKILNLENYETCSMLNVLIINSQMVVLLKYFIINLQTKLIISCEETNSNSNSKGGLRIA